MEFGATGGQVGGDIDCGIDGGVPDKSMLEPAEVVGLHAVDVIGLIYGNCSGDDVDNEQWEIIEEHDSILGCCCSKVCDLYE